MKDKQIDDALSMAAGATPPVEAALLKRITRSLSASLQPVNPLPSPWLLTGEIAAIWAAIALTAGTLLGMHGLQKMGGGTVVVIFGLLTVFGWLGSMACVAEMIPGSRHVVTPRGLWVTAFLTITTVCALCFEESALGRFVERGVVCLEQGLVVALIAAAVSWLVIRRGVAVDPIAGALTTGALSGLAGLTALELHCTNFETTHVIAWHATVPVVAAAVAMALVWAKRGVR